MLLTSSQVSVLISSSIVVLCTAALFFSGYVIQQRTLHDLRTAIKINREPRPSPKIYLPDRFKKDTTELQDGTVVDLDDPRLGRRRRKVDTEEDDIIIVRPTFPDEEKPDHQKPVAAEKDDVDEPSVGTRNIEEEPATNKQKPMSRAERRQKIKEEIRKLSEGQQPVYYQRRLW
ncbi:hypothetical protein F4804DRAFT_322398 [Jackrogersella minutella]|nr:hypothetical protein F4804DRAFT_322398 [Jackrogersella minutella]